MSSIQVYKAKVVHENVEMFPVNSQKINLNPAGKFFLGKQRLTEQFELYMKKMRYLK